MEKFKELLEDVLEREDEGVNPSDTFRDYDEWDSLSILAVGAMINEEYDITIPRNDFEKLLTVQDLFEYIKRN